MDPASYPTPPPAPCGPPATPWLPRPPCLCLSSGSSLEAPFCGEEVSGLPLPSLAPRHPDGASQPPGQGPALLSPSSRAFGGPRLEAWAGPPQVKGQRDLRVNRTQLPLALPSPPSSGGFWLNRHRPPPAGFWGPSPVTWMAPRRCPGLQPGCPWLSPAAGRNLISLAPRALQDPDRSSTYHPPSLPLSLLHSM